MTGRASGVNTEVAAQDRLLRQVYLQAGYRFWWVQIVEGEWQNHPRVGQPVVANLNEFTSKREGAIIGIVYSWSAALWPALSLAADAGRDQKSAEPYVGVYGGITRAESLKDAESLVSFECDLLGF